MCVFLPIVEALLMASLAGGVESQEFSFINPTSGAKLWGIVFHPADVEEGRRYPAVVIIPGGLGFGSEALRTPEPRIIAQAGFVVGYFDPDGRGKSKGEEDWNGKVQQDGLHAFLKLIYDLPFVLKHNIGVLTSSYGIALGAGTLGRYPDDPPVRYLIDIEGPSDRFYVTKFNHPRFVRFFGHTTDDEEWWAEREAVRWIKHIRCAYLRVQHLHDHVHGPDKGHAIAMINAATNVKFGGQGESPWTRINGPENRPNSVYTEETPPIWLPDRFAPPRPNEKLRWITEMAGLTLRRPFPRFWHELPEVRLPIEVKGVPTDMISAPRRFRELMEWVHRRLARKAEVDSVIPPQKARLIEEILRGDRVEEAARLIDSAVKGLDELERKEFRDLTGKLPKGDISGRVSDESGKPVEDALVRLFGTPIEARSDSEGRFTLKDVPVLSPRYIIIADKSGFIGGQIGRIAVREGKTREVEITLHRNLPSNTVLGERLAVKVGYVLKITPAPPPRRPDGRAVLDESLYPQNVRRYLLPSPEIDSDHPDVQRVAREILESLPEDKRRSQTAVAKAVYEWVVRNIEYDLIHNYPGDPTCGNWQTTFGGWGHSFSDWCYKASEVLRERRAICIEFERLTSALLRALRIPARPAPLRAHPVTQWWVQLPDGTGYWANMETSGGRTIYREKGDLAARFPAVPEDAIAFWSIDETAPIHLDWYTENPCLWLEDYGQEAVFPPNEEERARRVLREFTRGGLIPGEFLSHGPRRGIRRERVEVYTRGFVIDLNNLGRRRKILVQFPIFKNREWFRTIEVDHWTNHPEWVVRRWREKRGNKETGEEMEFYCIEFEPAPPWVPPRPGPWYNDLYRSFSENGLGFEWPGKTVVRHGGVPSLTMAGDGRIFLTFQWFSFDSPQNFNRIAVTISSDGGKTWSDPQAIEIEGLPEGHSSPCDPMLVGLKDGRFRLYFTCSLHRGERARTLSAISEDGLHFRVEPGDRFADPENDVLDPAVVFFRGKWHYYAPIPGARDRAYHAVSEDGLNFRRLSDVDTGGIAFLGCAVVDGDRLRFYGTGPGGVQSAISDDGERWAVERGVRLDGGADPGVVRSPSGKWLMVYTRR